MCLCDGKCRDFQADTEYNLDNLFTLREARYDIRSKTEKLRTDNMLTQEQLADKLFVTRTAVSKWETDRGFPSIDSLKAVADLFNVRIDDLVSEDDIENKKLADEKKGAECII